MISEYVFLNQIVSIKVYRNLRYDDYEVKYEPYGYYPKKFLGIEYSSEYRDHDRYIVKVAPHLRLFYDYKEIFGGAGFYNFLHNLEDGHILFNEKDSKLYYKPHICIWTTTSKYQTRGSAYATKWFETEEDLDKWVDMFEDALETNNINVIGI